MTASNVGFLRRFSVVVILVAVLGPAAMLPHQLGQLGSPAISRQDPNATPLNLNVTLHGRGATFPAPVIQLMAQKYHEQYPNTTIEYNIPGDPTGSGAGRNALWNKTLDFAGSDAPLSPSQRYLAPNVLHIPETVGSVVLAYHLNESLTTFLPKGLNLTGSLIAE